MMRVMTTMNTYDYKAIESHVRALWKTKKVPEKIVVMDWNRPKFYLLDGPPYVNGVPHVGHAKTTVFKDVWGRFKYMQGYGVWFQPGFDCGGLPIENKVEQELGIKSKTDIETKIGVSRFIEACQKFARGNEHAWLDFYKNIGAWRGWPEPYLTSENYYVKSGWWTVKQWFDRGLLSEGLRPGFWCSRCETVLAGIEASESYKNVEDPSIILRLRISEHEYLLVWTTTPWTLPGNVAVVVHPDETYVKIKIEKDVYVIAEKRLSEIEQLGYDFHVVEKFPGTKLAGICYEAILDVPVQHELEKNDAALRVYVSVPVMKRRVASKTLVKSSSADASDEFGHMVTMDVGTGLVHTAPGHGDIDNRVGRHYGLPEPSPVDERGRLTDEAGEFSGLYVKQANKKIIEWLASSDKLFHEGKIVHSYPLCWRCKTPLIYRMSRQWFLRLDALREKVLVANEKVKWLPEFARERYHNTISEAPDWAVTRQRYWGIPLPIWTCESCSSRKVIGSLEELQECATEKIPKDMDLHKHTVDKVTLRCGCGSVMHREKDIMDVWFDSGIAPWASLGYPFENKELFERLWHVDLIDESQDQVKAWFDKLMLCGFATFDKAPFVTACLNGWTLDERGEKMSKSLGNVVYAADAYKELGADVLRLYICSDVAPWDTQKFSLAQAREYGRQLNIVLNCLNYFKTYGTFETNEYQLAIEDQWILSALNTLVQRVRESVETFHFEEATRSLLGFAVDDFSRTYIKLVRDRRDKAVNYTMTSVLTTFAKLLAPFAPFIADYIYGELMVESVHLQPFPEPDTHRMQKDLEDDVRRVNEIVAALNAFRKERNLKQRWPLEHLWVDTHITNKDVRHMIASLANVTHVSFGTGDGTHNVEKIELERGVLYVDAAVRPSEALVRELTREIQENRKKKHLVVTDKIELWLDNTNMRPFEQAIREKVGAASIHYEQFGDELGVVQYGSEYVRFKFNVVK